MADKMDISESRSDSSVTIAVKQIHLRVLKVPSYSTQDMMLDTLMFISTVLNLSTLTIRRN